METQIFRRVVSVLIRKGTKEISYDIGGRSSRSKSRLIGRILKDNDVDRIELRLNPWCDGPVNNKVKSDFSEATEKNSYYSDPENKVPKPVVKSESVLTGSDEQ